MKLNKALSSLLIAGCYLGIATTGFAATCSNLLGPINATGVFPGNDCGNNAAFNNALTFCGGTSYSGTGTDVWQISLGAAQNFTFSVTSAVFTPDIALFASGSCLDNSNCVNATDYSTGTGTATSGTFTGNAAGTYFIVVTDSTAAGAQCGAYNLTVNPTLPVKLQDFSIQ